MNRPLVSKNWLFLLLCFAFTLPGFTQDTEDGKPTIFVPAGLKDDIDFITALNENPNQYLIVSNQQTYIYNIIDKSLSNIYTLKGEKDNKFFFYSNGTQLVTKEELDDTSLSRIIILDGYSGKMDTSFFTPKDIKIALRAKDSLLYLAGHDSIRFYNLNTRRYLTPGFKKSLEDPFGEALVIPSRNILAATRDLEGKKARLEIRDTLGRPLIQFTGIFTDLKCIQQGKEKFIVAVKNKQSIFAYHLCERENDRIDDTSTLFSKPGFEIESASESNRFLSLSPVDASNRKKRENRFIYDLEKNQISDTISEEANFDFEYVNDKLLLSTTGGGVSFVDIPKFALYSIPEKKLFYISLIEESAIQSFAVSDSGKRLSVVNDVGSLTVYDLASSRTRSFQLHRKPYGIVGHPGNVEDLKFKTLFCGRGRYLFSYNTTNLLIADNAGDSIIFDYEPDAPRDVDSLMIFKYGLIKDIKPYGDHSFILTKKNSVKLVDLVTKKVTVLIEDNNPNLTYQNSRLLNDSLLVLSIDSSYFGPPIIVASKYKTVRKKVDSTEHIVGAVHLINLRSKASILTIPITDTVNLSGNGSLQSKTIESITVDSSGDLVYINFLFMGRMTVNPMSHVVQFQPKQHYIPDRQMKLNNRWKFFISESNTLCGFDTEKRDTAIEIKSYRQANDFIEFNKQGYFDCPSISLNQLFWSIGNNIYPLEDFYANFFTPGLLFTVCNGGTLQKVPDISLFSKIPSLPQLLRTGQAVYKREGGQNLLCFKGLDNATLSLITKNRHLARSSDNTVGATICLDLLAGQPTPDKEPKQVVKADSLYFKTGKKGRLIVAAVGIGNYNAGSGIQPLHYSDTSLSIFRNIFAKHRQKLLKSVDTIIYLPFLTDSNATLTGIHQYLFSLNKLVKPDDILVIYFIGHGLIPASSELFYFLPYDAPARDSVGYAQAFTTAGFVDYFRYLRASRVLLIIDACQSGGTLESLGKISSHYSFTIFASSTPLQFSNQSSNGSTLIRLVQKSFDELFNAGMPVTISKLATKMNLETGRQQQTDFNQTPMILRMGQNFPFSRN